MQNNISNIKFFLGANSPLGFVSRFDQLYTPDDSWFCYILKGGPGTGKSTLMKKVAAEAGKHGIKCELIYCSSDPESLDGVIFPEIKVCIADGTSPHTLDPIYPGVADKIINLGECWDEEKIRKYAKDIIELTKQNSNFHKRSQRYLAAYGNIDKDTCRIVGESVNKQKVLAYSKRISKKLFKQKLKGKATENIRFISAVTPKGTVFFDETLSSMCDNLYVIDDEYGVVAGIILSSLKKDALSFGHNVTVCYCPLSPKDKIECLIIPSLNIGFVTSNQWHPLLHLKACKKIHTKRFLDLTKLSARKQRLSFNRRIGQELLDEAINNLSKAKSVHDLLEQFYVKSMNYQKLNVITNSLVKNITNQI